MTFFLSLFLLLAILVMAMLYLGARLPKTHVAASRIRLNVPPATVWAVITDFPAYPGWRRGLASVEYGPEYGGLPSWYEYCTRDSWMHFRVVEWEPPARLVTCIVGEELLFTGTWEYRIEPEGEGTLLTITERENIHAPWLRFLDYFVLRYHGVMDVYLLSLALHLDEPAKPEHLSIPLDGPAARV